MDIAKLEKMKVIDLRNELQSRGLDTKGVKAVLIERLRAHVEGVSGEGAPGTPGTPGRRSRRTRSMTRSPSCSPVRKTEPTLEPLEEESNTAAVNIDEEMEESQESQERYVGSEHEDIADEPDVDEEEQYHEIGENEDNEENEENDEEQEATEGEDNEEEMNEVATNEPEIDQQDSSEEQMEENIENNEEEDNSNSVDETSNKENDDVSSKGNEDSIEQEEKVNIEKTTDHVEHDNNDVGKDENVTSEELNIKEDNVEERNKENDDLNRSRKRSRDHSRSHSRTETRSRSPKRRSDGSTNISPTKGEDVTNLEDEPVIEDKQFGLSWFDSDLHLRIDPVTFTSAKPISEEIYALVWSGARTNFGVREGKVCYEVRLSEEVNMDRTHQFRDEPHVRGFRVGFSMPDSTLILGEAENSFAYCESGRIAVNSQFSDYGKAYQLDDVIGCYLDLETTPCTIKYTLNGEDLGVAFEFDISILGESNALFPHVVTKGYEFQVNFADNENLLANVERPKRMRRKPRNEKDNENWKVIDEAKTDDDEKQEESTKDEDKHKQADNETETNADANKNDGSEDNTDKNEGESVEMSTANKNNAEITTAAENGNNGEKTEDDIEDEQKQSEKQSGNDLKDDEKDSNEKAETIGDRDIDEKDDGASPSKKQKTEDEDKKYQSDSTEDEYEEVLPEPRETVFLLADYELIALIPEEKYVSGPQKPDSRKECEVILLVGLPGAGKTHWALNHIKENPDKRYHVIGVDALMSKMTVDGVGRKSLHKGRWEKVYDLCMKSLSLLEDIATKRRRNFILDQTNAYASVQRRKMKGFGDFKRIAVVCIPNEEELNRRNTEKTENGIANTIRESTLNSLRANFSLPSLEFDWFDDIIYSDLSGDEAKEEVKKYNEKGKKELEANPSNRDKRNRRDHHYKRDDDRRRYNDRRHDFRNDNRRNDRYNDRRRDFRNDNRRIDRRGIVNSGGWNSGGNNQPNWMQNNRNRYDDRYNHRSSGNGSQQNWGQNRNRYDDRYNHRSGGNGGGGGGGGRYDSYGGGGGGSRDYRDRNNRQQRDFRPGHRDNRTEDSRGGYDRSGASSSKHSKDGYDQYNSNKGPNQGGKWSTYGQQATQQPQQHANWQQANQYQQQAAQHQYWNYNNMQGGYDNQQQWQNPNANQQQDWMSWWQQQGGNPQQSGVNEANHYWSQYSYPAPATQASNTEATKKK